MGIERLPLSTKLAATIIQPEYLTKYYVRIQIYIHNIEKVYSNYEFFYYFKLTLLMVLLMLIFVDSYSGGSSDWAKAVAGVKYTYCVELRDRGKEF